jgi:hypothetical protein
MIPNICWVGDHGTGKRTALHAFLKSYAAKEGIPFHIKTKYLVGKLLNSISSSNGTEAADSSSDSEDEVPVTRPDDDKPADGKFFPFEVSSIHQGYDVARMSLQDKNYIYTIFKNFSGSSYVLSTNNFHFVVFYHAHLMSEESVIFLQEKLEQYSGCLRLFFTSQYPLPQRLADHFIEIQMETTHNYLYDTLRARYPHMPESPAWTTWFTKTLKSWSEVTWTTGDVPIVRQWIYFCLQRNLRWCELIEYWTRAIEAADWLPGAKKLELYRVLSFAEGGGGWQIIPSYRIPLLWESLLLSIIAIIGKN